MSTYINKETLDQAQSLLNQGKVHESWEVLGNAGDNYAINAAKITDQNNNSFAKTLVKETWENTVGEAKYNDKFDDVARQHLDNYIFSIRKINEKLPPENDLFVLPKTTDIEASYGNALETNGISPKAAIDGILNTAVSGTGLPGWTSWLDLFDGKWGNDYDIEDSRISEKPELKSGYSRFEAAVKIAQIGIESVNNESGFQNDWEAVSGYFKGLYGDSKNLLQDLFSKQIKDQQSNLTPNQIDNSNLDLQINTNLTSNFRGSNDLTQSGNAIGDADWRASMKLDVINGDGWKNVAMAGLVTDFNNPARQTISPYETFAKDLGHEVSALESGFANSSAGQSLWNSTQLNVNLSNLANSSINARTFVNIDPVVLDLNGDGVKLTSYNDSQVTFDVDNDGKQERTGWVSSQDGILVHDKNQDGKINNITETISEFCLRVKLCETKTPTPIATPKIETRSMIKSQICCIATYKKTRVRLKSKNFPTTSLSVYEKFPYLNNINSIFKPEHNQQQRKKVSGPDTRHYFLVKKYLSVRCRDLTPFFDQLTQKQRAVLDVIIKNCPEAIQIKATNSSNKTGDTINKKVSAR